MDAVKKPEFSATDKDRFFWQELEKLIEERKYRLSDILEHFPAYIMRRFLGRFLAHYELFKLVQDLPGCIVEIGVFRGRSFFTWGHLLETFCPADRRRNVYGFDHFAGLQEFTDRDGRFDDVNDKVPGGWRATQAEIEKLCELHTLDGMVPGVPRCHLVPGDIRETLPPFLERNPGLRISLLHLDVDLYEPTHYALQHLYPLVLTGGVVCFDEYAVVPWQGETRAADDYFGTLPSRPVIQKYPFTGFPSGYFVKR